MNTSRPRHHVVHLDEYVIGTRAVTAGHDVESDIGKHGTSCRSDIIHVQPKTSIVSDLEH